MRFKDICKTVFCCTLFAFTACQHNELVDEVDNHQTLNLKINTAAVTDSRGLITSTWLPNGSQVGLAFVGKQGYNYMGNTYDNVLCTALGEGAEQIYMFQKNINLGKETGTLYSYFPYSQKVTDITEVTVATGDTDYMWGTPVTDISISNPEASVCMQHALAAVRVVLQRGTYNNIGQVSSFSIQSNAIAQKATLNGTNGELSGWLGVNEICTQPYSTTLDDENPFEMIVVPTTQESSITITLRIDGMDYTLNTEEINIQSGFVYTVDVTVDKAGFSWNALHVDQWAYSDDGYPVIQVGDHTVTLAGNIEGIAFNNTVNDDGSVTITAVPVDKELSVNEVSLSSNAAASMTQVIDESTGVRTITLQNVNSSCSVVFNGVASPVDYSDYADYIKLTYNVTDISQPVDIFSTFEYVGVKVFDLTNVAEIVVVEGGSSGQDNLQAIEPSYQYNFKTAGEHTVFVKFTDIEQIPMGAFYRTNVINVVLPNSVQIIGYRALAECERLTSVTIGSGVQTIAEQAFSYCPELTEVTIPNSVTIIGDYAFSECSGLTSVTIGSGVQTIAEGAFYYCPELTEVTIPNSVTTIGEYAFSECYSLKEVTIGSGVQTIGECAFSYCEDLNKITIYATSEPIISNNTFEGVKYNGTLIYPEGSDYSQWLSTDEYYLGYYNWNNALNLNSWVQLVYDVQNTNIDTQIFSDPTFFDINSVESLIVLSDNDELQKIEPVCYYRFNTVGNKKVFVKFKDATKIPDMAFRYNYSLKEVNIPNTISKIGKQAFKRCQEMITLNFSNTVTVIDEEAFMWCEALTEVTIPNSMISIENRAFEGCIELMSLDLGTGVQTLGECAFGTCRKLAGELIIPNSVTEIGTGAFQLAENLISLKLGSSLKTIGEQAFWGCNILKEVTIGPKVTNIGISAFACCYELNKITSLAMTAPSISDNTFHLVKSNGTLIVPTGATGYDTWMQTDNYYLGNYNWTMQTISE